MSNNPRIGQAGSLPALTISGQPVHHPPTTLHLGGGYLCVLDMTPTADADALIAALTAEVTALLNPPAPPVVRRRGPSAAEGGE